MTTTLTAPAGVRTFRRSYLATVHQTWHLPSNVDIDGLDEADLDQVICEDGTLIDDYYIPLDDWQLDLIEMYQDPATGQLRSIDQPISYIPTP